MIRARELSCEEWEAFDVESWRNCEEYIVPVENKRDSFGVFAGRIVAVDYGS
jgi:hypothetical protein